MRIGFIGGHGHHYLRGLLHEPDLHAQFAVSGDGLDQEAAGRLRGSLPEALWFESPRELLDEFQPDVVSVGSIYGHNGDLAALVLERDVPVVCDKPIAATEAQLDRLRQLTEGTSRRLITEFPFRSRAPFRAARQAVQEGQIGKLVLATAQKSYRFGQSRPAWYANRAEYGGTLLWIASHGIDALRFCGGVELARCVALQGNLSRPEYGSFEDHVAALFELENGGSAMVHADYLRPPGAPTHGDDRLRLAGTSGLLEVRDDRCWLTTASAHEDITESVAVRGEALDMLEAALQGETQWYSTAESLKTAAVLLQCRKAADAREWVGLNAS